VHTANFDYSLPPELIAQAPTPQRDQSRLLVLQRADGRIHHRRSCDVLDYLSAGDLLVLNNSRVVPARLRAAKAGSSGRIEVLLVEEKALNDWWVLLRPGKRVRAGTNLIFANRHGLPTEINATVIEKNEQGHYRVQFSGPVTFGGAQFSGSARFDGAQFSVASKTHCVNASTDYLPSYVEVLTCLTISRDAAGLPKDRPEGKPQRPRKQRK